MKKQEIIPREYFEQFGKIISYSDNITKLYLKLCDAEYKKGKDSAEYKKLISYIEMAVDYENKLLEKVFEDSSVLSLFKRYMTIEGSKRLLERCNSDYDLAFSIYNSEANDKYDSLIEGNSTFISRDLFLKDEYEFFGKNILKANILYLINLKKYVLLLDEYINNAKNDSVKKFLIYEKNITLSKNRALESWYFNFENNDLQCMLVDSDGIAAEMLDISEESFYNLKINHFYSMCDDLISVILMKSDDPDEVKMLYEISLLASMLNMNVEALNCSYSTFKDEIKSDTEEIDEKSIEQVEDIFSKCLKLSKKLSVNYPVREEV